MNKIIRLLPLLAIGCLVTSCANNDGAYDENALANQKRAEYTAAFEKEFGTIASNQDWGFGTTTSSAKVGTRTANANNNEWSKYVVVPENITQTEIDKVYVDEYDETKTLITIAVSAAIIILTGILIKDNFKMSGGSFLGGHL